MHQVVSEEIRRPVRRGMREAVLLSAQERLELGTGDLRMRSGSKCERLRSTTKDLCLIDCIVDGMGRANQPRARSFGRDQLSHATLCQGTTVDCRIRIN